jgi:toxin CptA
MPFQRIEIRPSNALTAALCLAHPGAVAAIWCAGLPPWLKGALTVGIGVGLVWSLLSQARLRAAESVVGLEITAEGRLSLLTRGGTWRTCELLGTSYVSPQLTILNLRPAGRRLARHVVLVPDNVDARDFRRVRTWLRWAARSRPQHGNDDDEAGLILSG